MIQKRSPLYQKKVVVTRDTGQADHLLDRLAGLGALPLAAATIEITPPSSWAEVDQALEHWSDYSWVIFTSANAVNFFVGRTLEKGIPPVAWGGKKLAAVGRATSAALAACGLSADLVPEHFTGAALANLLVRDFPDPPGPALLPRSDKAREELPEILTRAGWTVHSVCAYRTRPLTPPPDLLEEIRTAQAIIFASPSAVEGFADGAGSDFFTECPALATVSIGPSTTQALAALHPPILLEAEPHSIQGIIRTLEAYFNGFSDP